MGAAAWMLHWRQASPNTGSDRIFGYGPDYFPIPAIDPNYCDFTALEQAAADPTITEERTRIGVLP